MTFNYFINSHLSVHSKINDLTNTFFFQSTLISPEDRQLTLDDVQGMFVLLGGGILLAALTLLIEYIKWKRTMRKLAQIGIKNQLKRAKRSKSLVVKEHITAEPFRPLTT